jgi:hypothetical protein
MPFSPYIAKVKFVPNADFTSLPSRRPESCLPKPFGGSISCTSRSAEGIHAGDRIVGIDDMTEP